MKKHSLGIAILFSTFFPTRLFAANILDNDDQKEGFSEPTQLQKQTAVHDYTILNNKNVNHTLDDIEDVEDELKDDVSAVNAKLIITNNQPKPLILGAVLANQQNHEYHQYLITSTGFLSKATQPKAVKRAHKTSFHIIKATSGHVILQLLEWLQIYKHYTVTALHTNTPICHNCYLIASNLWKKELPNNKKGCLSIPFPLLDKMPDLAHQYINTHLNLSLVKSLVVPMMGYVSKEEMNKAIQQKDKETAAFIASMQTTKDKQIQMLYQEINKQKRQLNEKNKQLEEKNEQIQMLNKEINKKDKQLKKNQQKIAALKKSPHRAKNKQPRNDNMEEVEKFLNSYKDLKDEYRRTPFLCAVQGGYLNIAKLLKKQHANINDKDGQGNNALHLACLWSKSVPMVTWLLDVCKLALETKGYAQRTPFLFAAQKGQLGIAKLLKQRGANIKKEDMYGYNALHLACGTVEMVAWLLDVCKIEIEAKGYAQRTPFLFAAEKGQLAIAKLLKQRGANIKEKDKDGYNALHLACLTSSSVAMVTWLLDVCKLALETKGQYQRTPFLYAAEKGQLGIAKLLKQRGANIKEKDKDRYNALHLACLWSGSEEIVIWLSDVCKIGLETKGKYQRTPFLYAVEKGQFAIAKLLRQRGANTHAKDENGYNALHLACLTSSHVAMATWLLDVCKIGIETKGYAQRTPFLYAAEKGQLGIAKLLKQRGANIHAKGQEGNNALYLAKYNNHKEMINCLKSWGLT